MIRKGTILLSLLLLMIACQPKGTNSWVQKPLDQWPEVTLTNEVVFEEQSFSDFGAGFLVCTDKDTFAVTSKQLFVAFSGLGINTIDFKGKLISWNMYPKNHPEERILLGDLVNPDSSQFSVFPNATNSSDWLVFRIKNNSSNVKPFKLSQHSLKEKQRLFAVYRESGQKQESTPDILPGSFIRAFDYQIFISLDHMPENPLHATGCPVISSDGYLAGLLTSINNSIGQSCSVSYLYQVLSENNIDTD